MGTKRVMQ